MVAFSHKKLFSARAVALLAVTLLALIGGGLWSLAHVHAASSFPSSYFAPYAEIGEGATLQTVTQSTGQKYYKLAFMLGNGCTAEWNGVVTLSQTSIYFPNLDSDIQYIRSQGGDVVVSFGGEAGQELAQTCSNTSSLQAQYQAVINQYGITHLDFDIEGGEEGDSTTYTRRNAALAALQAANPGLVISFTLPSAKNGLLDTSIGLLKNAVSQGVNIGVVNLMTMDYGGADSQMGQESINAANALHSQLQSIYPAKTSSQLWSMVGITPMIGQNDSQGEIFSPSDAAQVLSFAQSNHIGELSFWAVTRDNGSCAGSTTASDHCSGLSQSSYAFINAWKGFTSGGGGGTTPPPVPTSTPAPSTPTPAPTSTPMPPLPTPPTSGNLVTNPGFETGTLSGWSCDPGDAVVGSPVHSGSHALQLAPSGSTTGQCTQTIAVHANSTYTLKAYVQGSYAYIGVNGQSNTWTSSGSYTQLSYTFTTGASTTSVVIYLHGWYSQGNVYVDDLSLS